jgi:hypothetical protein
LEISSSQRNFFSVNFQATLHNLYRSYTYWDYQQGWFNTFLLQNSKDSHSWLFYFNNSINTSKLPNWFRQWLDYFGSSYDLLQPHPMVKNGSNFFKQNYKATERKKYFHHFLFSIQNYLFLGFAHGALITTLSIIVFKLDLVVDLV